MEQKDEAEDEDNDVGENEEPAGVKQAPKVVARGLLRTVRLIVGMSQFIHVGRREPSYLQSLRIRAN